MKCGSRRHIWHNRWFVLSGEKLLYCRSHMDTKPHRQIPLSQILDALEYDLPTHRNAPSVNNPPVLSPHTATSVSDEPDGSQGRHTFKVVTTKRTLLLCAPSEMEEIKWLSAVRALIARRSGAGVLPGDSAAPTSGPRGTSAPTSGAGNAGEMGVHGGGSGISGSVPSTGTSIGGRRKDSIARRLSLSGGGGFSSSATPQDAVSERQS